MSNKSWLVKSSGRIFGPLTYEDVYSGLRTREYALMDEVSLPCSRWNYIYETEEFKSIVEEIRHINLKHSDDETTTSGTTRGSGTQTLSLTDVNDPSLTDELTDDILSKDENTSSASREEINNVEDAFYQSFDDLNYKSKDAQNSFIYEGDARAQNLAQANTRWLWAVTAVAIIGVLTYIGFSQFVAKPIKDKNTAELQVKTGLEAFKNGDYQVALEFLGQAYQINPDEKSILLPLALLEIRERGETVKALRLLDKLQSKGAESKVVLNARGLAALKDSQYEKAEGEFEKALRLDPLYRPAIVNLGATALYEDDPTKATGFLELAIKDGNQEGLIHLMLIEAFFKVFDKTEDAEILKRAMGKLDFSIQRTLPFYRQKLIAKIYSLKLLGRRDEVKSLLPEFLDTSMTSMDEFRQDPMIHMGHLDNKVYSQWCLQALADMEPSPYVVSTEAVCLQMANDLMGASQKIEDAVAQAPRERLVNSVYASLLLSMNAPERAKSAAEKALRLEASTEWRLPYITAARLCDSFKCGEKNWQRVLSIEPNSLEANTQLGALYFANGQLAEAERHIEKALLVNSTYTAALTLQSQLSQAIKAAGAQ